VKKVLGLIVLVGLLATGCSNTVSSSQLKLGDCLNYVSSQDANGDNVNLPVVVDCDQTHSDEVFSVFDYPNASVFPGYEAIGAIQQTHCEADFKAYVGVDWEQSTYTIAYVSPTQDTWASGDRAIHCLLEDGSGGQLTGSARGTNK
jgi:Septum formation